MLDVRPRVVFTFYTTTAAMAMEAACHAAGQPGRLIPVPGTLRAGCGLCWAADPAQRAALETFVQSRALQIEGIFEVEI